jgi:hypothetical protein
MTRNARQFANRRAFFCPEQRILYFANYPAAATENYAKYSPGPAILGVNMLA